MLPIEIFEKNESIGVNGIVGFGVEKNVGLLCLLLV